MERVIIASLLQNDGVVLGSGKLSEKLRPDLFGRYRAVAECIFDGDFDITSISKKNGFRFE